MGREYFQECAGVFTTRRGIRTGVLIALLTLALPVGVGFCAGTPPETVIALVTSTLVLQATAALVGLGLGLDPLEVVLVMTPVAIASMIAVREINREIGQRSVRVRHWAENIHVRTRRLDFLRRYGAIMLIPTIWVPGIGLFGTPVVAWIFGWDRGALSIVYMVIGWLVATGVVIATTLEMVNLFL